MSVLQATKSRNEEGIGMNKFRNEEIEVDFVFIVFSDFRLCTPELLPSYIYNKIPRTTCRIYDFVLLP